MTSKTLDISRKNDSLRKTFAGGKVVLTRSVRESDQLETIVQKVKEFNTFTEGDDPYKEHDFGTIEVSKKKYFWKIDYYDSNYEYGLDPHEEETVYRVLTIMRSDEY